MSFTSVSYSSGISPYPSNSYDNRTTEASSIDTSGVSSSPYDGQLDSATLSAEATESGESADVSPVLLSGLEQNYGQASDSEMPVEEPSSEPSFEEAEATSQPSFEQGALGSDFAECNTAIVDSTDRMMETQTEGFLDLLAA